MKKIMILAAAAALVFASCAKSEITSVNEENTNHAIGFSNYVPRATTKAATANYVDGSSVSNLVVDQQFGVYAWAKTNSSETPWSDGSIFAGSTEGAPNFMNNVAVTFKGATAGADGSANTYATRYWPSGDTPDGLTFFAYYPVGGDGISLPDWSTNWGEFTYVANTAAASQTDFMVSNFVANQYYGHTNSSYSTGSKGTVDLTFKHVLTRVKFVFKTDNTDTKTNVVLTNAQLLTVKNTNSLTVGYTKKTTTETGTTAAVMDPATASAPQTFDVTVSGTTPSATNVVLTTGGTTPTAADVFLMVPQTIAASAQKITLTWLVKTYDTDAHATTNGTEGLLSTTTNTKTIDLLDIKDSSSNAIQWVTNKSITYTITIGPKPIYFTGAVDNWTPEAAGSIDVN